MGVATHLPALPAPPYVEDRGAALVLATQAVQEGQDSGGGLVPASTHHGRPPAPGPPGEGHAGLARAALPLPALPALSGQLQAAVSCLSELTTQNRPLHPPTRTPPFTIKYSLALVGRHFVQIVKYNFSSVSVCSFSLTSFSHGMSPFSLPLDSLPLITMPIIPLPLTPLCSQGAISPPVLSEARPVPPRGLSLAEDQEHQQGEGRHHGGEPGHGDGGAGEQGAIRPATTRPLPATPPAHRAYTTLDPSWHSTKDVCC